MSSTASVTSRGDDDTGSVDMDYQPDAKRKKIIKLDPVRRQSCVIFIYFNFQNLITSRINNMYLIYLCYSDRTMSTALRYHKKSQARGRDSSL